MTPEGKVKRRVSTILKSYGSRVYYFMPVQGGFGASTLDYLGCAGGKFFAVETKAPGKKPTPRQQQIIQSILSAGGAVFVIDGSNERVFETLDRWIKWQLSSPSFSDMMVDDEGCGRLDEGEDDAA